MNIKCPYCKSEKTEVVVIRFSNNQEQRVNLCKECKRVFRKEAKDE